MRSTNYELTYKKEIEVTNQIVTEKLSSITENKDNKTIEIIINGYDELGYIAKTEYIDIIGYNYDLIMSDKPSFAPSKPANEYREEDLWYMVDKIKSEMII